MRILSLRAQRSVENGSTFDSGSFGEGHLYMPRPHSGHVPLLAPPEGVPTQALSGRLAFGRHLPPHRLYIGADVQGSLCKKSGGDLGRKGESFRS